jgi:hypothetical protein
MKDLLEILQNVNTLPTTMLSMLVVAVVFYFCFLWWKNYLSESSIIENQKKKLKLIKLGLEIEKLKKETCSSDVAFANDSRLKEIFESCHVSKKNKFQTALEAFAHRPFTFLKGLFVVRPKWLRYFFAGGFTSCAYPVFVICYTVLHLPPNTSAETLYAVVWIQLGFLAFAVVIGAILAAIFNLGELLWSCLLGLSSGFVLFQLAAALFTLITKIWAVFRNAH